VEEVTVPVWRWWRAFLGTQSADRRANAIAWLRGLSPAVRRLAMAYPPGRPVALDGECWFVVSYGEAAGHGPGLCLSRRDPAEDYEGAIGDPEKRYVCGACTGLLGAAPPCPGA
jgi:hypothetical protein